MTAAPTVVAAAPTASPISGEALADVVGADAIHAHLVALQDIADRHGGSRAAGTAGFDASVEYVAARLEAAGYVVERQPVAFGGTQTVNLLAERPGSGDARVVMLGAHLDSHSSGPGINDNGSGSMTLLVLAERLADLPATRHGLRFAFWAAEEPGLVGSSAYVAGLNAEQRAAIVAYLNLDIIGSPNFIRFVYADSEAPAGSAAIGAVFADAFDSAGLPWEPIDLSGKSDQSPFSRAGIPTGGLFSGGREPKSDAQAAAYGGRAGLPADGCADHACDTIANVNLTVLEQMADAAARTLVALADG